MKNPFGPPPASDRRAGVDEQALALFGDERDPLHWRTTASLTYDKINDLVAAKDAILQTVVADTAIERPEQLIKINNLFIQPFTKAKYLTDARMYVGNTARKYLHQLVDMGVPGKKVISGHHHYLNLELHRILSE